MGTEITVKTGDKRQDSTIASNLAEVGTHVYVDQKFNLRMQGIKTEMERRFSLPHLKALRLSPLKTELALDIKNRMAYLWESMPEGKAIERPFFAKKMQAAGRILLRAWEALCAGASDDDTQLVVTDMIWKVDTLVGFTFDSQTNSIQKAFTVTGVPNMGQGGAGGGFMDSDTKEAMKEVMRQKAEREAAAKG